MRVILNFTKLGAMGYISHLDLQRLWQRIFRIAGLPLLNTQGFNPRPRLRFALPLATGFQSENELLEIYLAEKIDQSLLMAKLNHVCPEGLKVKAATEVPEEFPKITALVSALEYRVEFWKTVEHAENWAEQTVPGKAGGIKLSEHLLSAHWERDDLIMLLKVEDQQTIRPDLIVRHMFAPQGFTVIRTAICSRAVGLEPNPAGLTILFD